MFRIPTVTRYLLLANVACFVLMLVFGGIADLNNVFGLHFFLASDFHLYQLVSYMFMHANLQHIFFNMFALWMFGCVVERTWGARRFLIYYMVCGIGAGLSQEIAQFCSFYLIASEQIPDFSPGLIAEVARNSEAVLNQWTTVGASGAIFGILLAFGMLYPNERIFIFPLPVPIKAKWFVCIYAVVELLSAMGSSGDNVAHMAHLGGMLFGFFLIRYWQRRPYITLAGEDEFFSNLRRGWEQRTHRRSGGSTVSFDNSHNSDWDYNARKKQEEEEIDEILDKIRRSGYDSLTAEEKRRLFDSSNRKD